MKITGYKLREALKKQELRRDAALAQFKSSLYRFEGDDKLSPDDVMKTITEAETAIAKIQAAQTEYNSKIQVTVSFSATRNGKKEAQSEKMSLCAAVKTLGGAGRVEKLWRDAAGTKQDTRRYYDEKAEMTRQTDHVYAKSVLTPKETLERAHWAASWSAALRSSVAAANATEVEIDLDSSLLE